MADVLELDYETFSAADLEDEGLDRYTADPEFEILMGAWAINGSDRPHWEAHRSTVPAELKDALLDPHVEKWIFNGQFERVCTLRGLDIDTPIKGWRCTQVMAGLLGFNGGLALINERIGVPLDQQKLKTGDMLIKTFTMPQRVTKNQPHRRRNWQTDPALWEDFCGYNEQDKIAERALRKRISKYHIPAEEWDLYEVDQEINDRGMPVDLVFVRHAIEMSNRRKAELTEQMRDICHLPNPGSVVQLKEWLALEGYWLDDLNKHSVEKALNEDEASGYTRLSYDGRRILKLRLWQSKLSIAKYSAMAKRAGEGDRIRYCFQMAGAGRTGRWAGRGVQTQNLKTTPSDLGKIAELEFVTNLIREGNYDGLSLYVKEPMDALTGCIRSAIRAPEGYQLLVADLKSIENAVVGWETGCKRILDTFAKGLDPYRVFASKLFGVPYDQVTPAQRKFCKPPVLGGSYRLGGGHLRSGVRTGLWKYAEDMGVDMTQAEAHRAIKVFRADNPEVVDAWPALEDGIHKALTLAGPVDQYGQYAKEVGPKVPVGKVEFQYVKPFLVMWLPTGRGVWYFKPYLKNVIVNTGRMIERRSRGEQYDGAPFGTIIEVEETFEKISLTYMGVDQKTRQKWQRLSSHGGKTIEQQTQATAREPLKRGLIRASRDGFPVILHSHDEIGALVRKGDNRLTLERLIDCMRQPLPEMPGLPLDAAGYAADFYRKD